MATTARITVVNTRPEHFPAIIDLSRRIYPVDPPWTMEQLASHLDVFPEGQLVACSLDDGAVVGMAASLIVSWDDYDIRATWRDFTFNGYFTNHEPEIGRTLYGAEVMADPGRRRQGIGTALYRARRGLAVQLGLSRIRAGARLRGYHRYAFRMSARDYVHAVAHRRLDDATLSFQLSQGFHVLDVVKGYLQRDPESLGWAAVIEWINDVAARPEDYGRLDPYFQPA